MNTSNERKIASINPYTLEVLFEVPNASGAEVSEAINLAWRSSFDSKTGIDERLALIMGLRDLIAARADEIAQLITFEVGKPIAECYSSEIASVLDTCVWLSKNAKKILASKQVKLANPLFRSNRSFLDYKPLGVVGIISPWNFPFSIPLTAILHAVAAGNTVVLKPSEKSPLVALLIKELFDEAGFPKGVLNVVTGDNNAGAELAQSSKLGRLILTGSVNAGKSVMACAARTLTPVTLELGGKDAAIVLPDAPVDFTARGLVWGAFMNGGQACASIERVFIVKGSRTEALIEALVEKTRALKVGNPLNPEVEVGPVIDELQLSRIENQVETAKSQGAKVLVGGARPKDFKGFFYQPTLVTDVKPYMSYMLEETFGPVMWIHVVDSVEDAIRLTNVSDYGLTASIWTGSHAYARAIAPRLDVGTVYVNDCIFSHAAPELPWGGTKDSGIGRSHSSAGLLDMVSLKNTNYNAAGTNSKLWWYPYQSSQFEALRGGIQLLHGSGLKKRLSGLASLLAGAIKSRLR